MFFVINKEKVYAYVLYIIKIFILFFMYQILNKDITGSQETSANTVNEQNMNYNNVNINENSNMCGDENSNIIENKIKDTHIK